MERLQGSMVVHRDPGHRMTTTGLSPFHLHLQMREQWPPSGQGRRRQTLAGRDSLSVASGGLSLLCHLTTLFTHAHLGAVYSGQHGVSLSSY